MLCILSALCTPALCCTKENALREEEWRKLFSTRSTGVPLGRRIQLPPSLPHQRVTPGTTQGRAPLSGGLSWARFITVYVRHKLKVRLELTITTESKLLQAKSTSVWEKPTSTCSSTLSFLWVQIPVSVLCLLYDFAQHSISCLCCSHVGRILKDEREKLNKTFLFLIVKGPWIFLSVLNSNTHRPEFSHLSCFIAQLSKWENKWILETKSQAIWSKFHFCH